ncbi:MAG: hypothetical protein WC919_06875 [Candidatus Paceibacterota bacterium]
MGKVIGPNVRKLICHRMSSIIVPPNGGPKDVFEAITTPNKLTQIAKESAVWVEEALAAIKSAPDNPFGGDDEAIAGEILRRLEERKLKLVDRLQQI